MKIPYYAGDIYNSVVIGHLTIDQWINAQKNPKPNISELLAKIREATSNDDLKLKQKLKEKLFYITPGVIIRKGNKRRYSSIVKFTGMAQLDFDKFKTKSEAEELKQYIFDMYEPIICAYLSPSGRGVKAIIKIPVVQDVEEYKDYYAAIEEEMLNQDKHFDHAPFNAVLPLYISEDPRILYRKDATTWNIKKDRTVEYVHLNTENESDFGKGMQDYEKSLHTVSIFKQKIEEIVSGDGHPRMRSACLVLGSRAGAGYIDIQQAYELAEYMISSNSYLAKKRNTYLKTANWAIKEGASHPQYY